MVFFCFVFSFLPYTLFKNSSVSCMFIRLCVQYCVCTCKIATRKLFPVTGSYGNTLKDSQCKNKSRLQGFLMSLLRGETSPALLRAHRPFVIEQAPQRVDLSDGDGRHDQQVDAGPEGDPPQVVLQEVAVPGLEGPQGRQGLAALLQVPVHQVHLRLER